MLDLFNPPQGIVPIFTVSLQAFLTNNPALDSTEGIAESIGIEAFAVIAAIKRDERLLQLIPGGRHGVFLPRAFRRVEGNILLDLIDGHGLGRPCVVESVAGLPGSKQCCEVFIGFVGVGREVLAPCTGIGFAQPDDRVAHQISPGLKAPIGGQALGGTLGDTIRP